MIKTKIYHPKEIAQLLQISEQQVCNLIDRDKIKGFDCAIPGARKKRRRVTEQALMEYMRLNEPPSAVGSTDQDEPEDEVDCFVD